MSSIDNIKKITDEKISEMFVEYVDSMEDKERHTKKACEEVEQFDKFCERAIPCDVKTQAELYNRMMDVAVEFEESGFIAGVKWTLDLIRRGCLIPEKGEPRRRILSKRRFRLANRNSI